MHSRKFGVAFSLGLALSGGLLLRGGRPARETNRWIAEPNMREARSGACSAMLPDGRVLVTGGANEKDSQASVEIFGVTGAFSEATPMLSARTGHACVTLRDGRVLVAGGRTTGGGVTNSAEIYDPASGSWSVTASMTEARAGLTASALQDGRVAFAGGETSGGAPTASLEIYDPATDTFAGVARGMSSPRKEHAAALLHDGRVVIAGGSDGSSALDSIDIYDPVSGTVSRAAKLSTPRAGLTATRLLDGKVFLAGGSNAEGDLASTEVFDPLKGVTFPAASMSVARRNHRAFRIPDNNQVLIAGGTSGGAPEASTESYIPWQDRFVPMEALAEGRTSATGSALKLSGRVMLAGGVTTMGATNSALTLAGPTVTTDKPDYAPGETVTITGTGWTPGETVKLSFVQSPAIDTHPDLFAVADASGNILNSQLVMNLLDAGVTFTLTATGQTSGLTAATTFTDANISSGTTTVKNAINATTCGTTATTVFNVGDFVCGSTALTVSAGGTLPDFFFQWFTPSSALDHETQFSSVTTGTYNDILNSTGKATGLWTVKACKTSGCNGGNLLDSKTFTLNAPTTTSVTPSVNPSTYGSGVSFTAVVTRTTGSGTPTGSVQFKIDGANFGSAVTLGAPATATTATAVSGTISTLTAGSHTVDAVYAPTGFFSASSGTVTQSVSQKALTISFTAGNKVYDATTTATILTRTLGGVVSPDVVTAGGGTATFADKNMGTGKTVSASGFTLSGAAAGNYLISPNSASTTANITARTLTVSAAGVNRVYDATTTATVTLSDDRVAGDVLTTSYASASFATKGVGTGKTVSVTGISVTGTDAGNYTFNTTASTTANITARSLTVTATASNKVYDGNATASVTLADNRVSGDALTTAFTTATFANKNVGTGKTVSVSSISISGADAGNYTVNTTASTTADITARPLTVTATGVNRVYDGTVAATVTLSDNRISGDVFTASYTSASFADKNAGTGKAVSVSGISISGTDSGNYTFNSTASTTADITARPLTISATGVNRVYDGTTTATVTLSDNRIAGDTLTTSYASATFANKNVGTGKTVSVSGISLSGADEGDYT